MNRRGYFDVSDIIYNHEWHIIWPELSKIFRLYNTENLPNGIVRLHGYSDFFEECAEGESKQYDCIVHTPSANSALINPSKMIQSIAFKLIK